MRPAPEAQPSGYTAAIEQERLTAYGRAQRQSQLQEFQRAVIARVADRTRKPGKGCEHRCRTHGAEPDGRTDGNTQRCQAGPCLGVAAVEGKQSPSYAASSGKAPKVASACLGVAAVFFSASGTAQSEKALGPGAVALPTVQAGATQQQHHSLEDSAVAGVEHSALWGSRGEAYEGVHPNHEMASLNGGTTLGSTGSEAMSTSTLSTADPDQTLEGRPVADDVCGVESLDLQAPLSTNDSRADSDILFHFCPTPQTPPTCKPDTPLRPATTLSHDPEHEPGTGLLPRAQQSHSPVRVPIRAPSQWSRDPRLDPCEDAARRRELRYALPELGDHWPAVCPCPCAAWDPAPSHAKNCAFRHDTAGLCRMVTGLRMSLRAGP